MTATTHAAPTEQATAWRWALLALAAGGVALLLLFAETVASVVDTWARSDSYNYGFLIVPIAAYLVWERRGRLRALSPRVSHAGLALLALGALGWLLGSIVGVLVVQQLAVVGMFQALALTFLGWRVASALIFPLAYLFFAVPMGEGLIAPLQDVTASIVVAGLRMINMPVFLDGLFIQIPGGRFEVAEACAGLRYLLALAALTVLFAEIMYVRWSKRIAFVAILLALGVVINGLRAFGIVMLAYYSDYTMGISDDHLAYGWGFYVVVTAGLFWLASRFRDPLPTEAAAAPPPAPARGARPFLVATAAALAVMGAAPAYSALIQSRVTEGTGALTTPTVAAPWRAVGAEADSWQPRFSSADRSLRATFADADDKRVQVYIAYFTHQRQGAEVISGASQVAYRAPWVRVGGGTAQAEVGERPMPIAATRVRGPEGDRLVWLWYWVDGRFTASPYEAKLLEAKAKLLAGQPAAAVIAIAADEGGGAPAAAVLNRFLAAVEPLDSLLGRVSRARAAR